MLPPRMLLDIKVMGRKKNFQGPLGRNVNIQMGVICGRSGAGSMSLWSKGIVMCLTSDMWFSAFQSWWLQFYLRVAVLDSENLSIKMKVDLVEV